MQYSQTQNSEEVKWSYTWKYGVEAVLIDIENWNKLAAENIRNLIINKKVDNGGIHDSIGSINRVLDFQIQSTDGKWCNFTATFESASKQMIVNEKTQVLAHFDDGSKQRKRELLLEKEEREVKGYIENDIEFDPNSSSTAFYEATDKYDSLLGIKKEEVLNELKYFLARENPRESWSKKHWEKILPIVKFTATKAPVLIFGGDPGTGKTALASNIGAKLAQELNESLLVWSISMSLRGMGFQGRAGTMVTRLFNYAKQVSSWQGNKPLLILFDEAEAVVGSRMLAGSSSGAEENVAIVNAIIRGLDQISRERNRIATIFISNLPIRIDDALFRRCSYYWFPRPDATIRRQIFSAVLHGCNFSENDIEQFVGATEPREFEGKKFSFTASDIIEVVLHKAMQMAMEKDARLSDKIVLDACANAFPTGFPRHVVEG